jgi:flagellar motor switch protein FliN
MSPSPPDVGSALLSAAQALPAHFAEPDGLRVERLSAIQATTLSLPGGAYAVETLIKGSPDVGALILVITGLVDHATGEVLSRDEARALWTAALTESLAALGAGVGELDGGQVHMTDAFDALDAADEATVVGVFRDQILAGVLLAMPATATGQGAAAELAAAIAEAAGELGEDGPAESQGQQASGATTPPPTASGEATPSPHAAGAAAANSAAANAAAAGVGSGPSPEAAPATAADGPAAAVPGPERAGGPSPVQLRPLTGSASFPVDPRRIDLLRDVMMGVSVELGRTRLSIQEILALTPGTIVELDRAADSPVDVLVNGKLIAHGEVVVVDEEFAVRISEVVNPEREGRVSA